MKNHTHENKRNIWEAYGRRLHLVWLKFLPHHIPGSTNSDKIHRNNREKLRHKERYTVSKAQRITAIFTTEKSTYSTVLYSTTIGTKGLLSYLSHEQQQKEILKRFLASVGTPNPELRRNPSFSLVVGQWWHLNLSYTLHRTVHASIYAVFVLPLCQWSRPQFQMTWREGLL